MFGLLLSALSFAVLMVFANLLAAVLALSGGAFYVVVYTLWLKRTTTQNIVIGGAAGAIPRSGRLGGGRRAARPGSGLPVRDRAPVDATAFLGAGAAVSRHYAAAGVPMMPVVRGPNGPHARSWSTRWCWSRRRWRRLLGMFGAVYLAAAVILGGVSAGLPTPWRERSPANAGLMFHFSLLYLALLFAAVAIDAAVR